MDHPLSHHQHRQLVAGKKVLVSPLWIERVSCNESMVFINLSRQAIQESPEYTADSLATRDYEISLHGHCQRRGHFAASLTLATLIRPILAYGLHAPAKNESINGFLRHVSET